MPRRLIVAIAAIIVIVGGVFLLYMLTEKSSGKINQTASVAHALPTATASVASSSAATTTPSAPVLASTTPKMQFEVVTTQAQQQRGLGGRGVIPDNYAMLFVFPKDDTYGFWMKDMLMPIDMIWLADDGTIIKIDASVPANSYPEVYYPPAPVKYVLETRAGFAAEQGWTIGTRVSLPLPY